MPFENSNTFLGHFIDASSHCSPFEFISTKNYAQWEILNEGAKGEFKTIDFFNENFGWIAGDNGTLINTQDGGENWIKQVEDLSPSLSAIHFKDGYGWAVGGNGLVLRTEDGSTWIEENSGKTYPNKFSMSQNYPNPFNPSTKIKFALPNADKVKIELYNTLGQSAKILLDKDMKAGHHEVEFNAQNLSSGIYYYRIEAGKFQDVKKMILIK